MTTTHNLIQGTDAWIDFRAAHYGASEAAAMMGLSPKVKRTELLYMKKTGGAKEFSEWVQKNILDHGHAVEALARPLFEEIIGDDLYPVTCSDGVLSASLDGLTLSGAIAFEHKQWRADYAAMIANGELPEEHMPQVQQVLMVSGAERLIFGMSNGTKEQLVYLWVEPDLGWFKRIRAGWDQFTQDLADYQHVGDTPAAVAAPTMGLPALSIQVNGAISLISNLDLFGQKLTAFIEGIDRNPSDDQAFADCEAAVKVLQKAQDALEAAEAGALAQTASIDEMRRTVAMYSETARTTRLMLEKLVKARKETIRAEIQQAGKDKADAHMAELNKRLGKPYMPAVPVDFAGVMKAKKTISSLRDAVDTELARFKIEANATADRIQTNLNTLRDLAGEHKFLFADAHQIVLKANDDCTALVKSRIAEHKEAEVKRLAAERARIAEEERIKAEAKVREEAAAEAAEAARLEAKQRAAAEQKTTEAAPTTTKEAPAPEKPAVAVLRQPAPAAPAAKKQRPSDAAIIAAVAHYFQVNERQATEWLSDLDLSGSQSAA